MLYTPIVWSLLYSCAFGATASVASYHLKALPSLLVRPADNSEYYCTSSIDWRTTTWYPKDCIGALQKLQHIEFETKRSTVYEFVEAGASQSTPIYYGQASPRKYVYESCTLSIVMMNDTKLETFETLLPHNASYLLNDNSTFTKTDYTTYQDVWYAFRQTYLLCTQDYRLPGWIAIGNEQSIGILLHATNSTIDQQINGTEPESTVADSLPTGWKYLGCNYGNSYDASFLRSWGGEGLSLARCAEYCDDLQYFGVQRGSECFCASSNFTSYSAAGGEMACNTTCNGNATELCGGESSLSVYQHIPNQAFVLPTWGVNTG